MGEPVQQLRKRLKRSRYNLETLFEIAQEFTSTLEFTRSVRIVLLTTVAHMGVGLAALFTRDDMAEYFVLRMSRGVPEDKKKTLKFPVQGELVEALSKIDRPVPLDRLPDSEEVAHLRAARVVMVAPLKKKGKLVGMMMLGKRLTGSGYSEEDVQVLTILAVFAAIGLENAARVAILKNRISYL